jgi:hypothetical protein
LDVEDHRLGQRHERRAERALQDPEHDDLGERCGRAAQHRGDREADDREDEQALAPP